MEKNNHRENKNKYNNGPDLEGLLEQYTLSFAEMTQYIEEKELYIIDLENQLAERSRIKYMVRSIAKKSLNHLKRIIVFVPQKIGAKFRGLLNEDTRSK